MFCYKLCAILLILCDTSLSQKQFICKDSKVIDFNLICDGNRDCKDESDETANLCFSIMCPKDMFKCSYGACITKTKRCDGFADCADSSDELRCKPICSKTEYPCSSGECIPNIKICDGITDCKDRSDEKDALCQDISCPEHAFHCQIGGCIQMENLCDGFKDCLDGSDETEVVCKQLKCKEKNCYTVFCPPITSTRLTVTCNELDASGNVKGLISCDRPIPVGTIANYQCKEYYVPSNKDDLNNTKAICQVDGIWSRNVLKCEPECGKIDEEPVALVVHGWNAKPGQWPWYAPLYCFEDGNWTFWCGSTLISESVVLTAAHCVWDVNIKEIVVAVGKYYSDFNKKEDETQIIKLSKILMQPHYQDTLGNYGSDIAILVLKEPVRFSKFARPVCVDWKSEYATNQLKENNIGMVYGLGVIENDVYSDHLKGTTLPVVSEEICIKNQKKDFKKYVTYTTFCAGYQNGTGVCNGDSGGGLIFPKDETRNVWYLQGIVSVSPRRHGTSFCDPNYYTIFTKVSKYTDWLQEILTGYGLYLTDEVVIEKEVIS